MTVLCLRILEIYAFHLAIFHASQMLNCARNTNCNIKLLQDDTEIITQYLNKKQAREKSNFGAYCGIYVPEQRLYPFVQSAYH